MRPGRVTSIVFCVLLVSLAGVGLAHADITAFVGNNATPSNRPVRGLALGFTLLVIGVEFELSDTASDASANAPSLRTGMVNVLAQTPFSISGLQFYATVGAGLYQEKGGGLQDTSAATNVGGGVKIAVAGPLRMRVDYRVFSLRGSPQHDTYHRLYASLNIGF
jgi:hypothetical protein